MLNFHESLFSECSQIFYKIIFCFAKKSAQQIFSQFFCARDDLISNIFDILRKFRKFGFFFFQKFVLIRKSRNSK